MSTPRLLGISGSLRRDSYATAVLRTLRDDVAGRAALTLFPLNDVPLYNQDDDTANPPEAVRALRAAIAAADGVVVISPEYNYGISGVLKNALDWASRPYGKSPLIGKPVLTMTASPAATGGVRAQQQLTETLISIQARLVLRPQIAIAAVHEKVRDGRLIDEAALQFARGGIDDLLRDVAALPDRREAA